MRLLCMLALAAAAMAQPAREALTLHAGFDGTVDADFARGDAKLYTAPDYKSLDKAVAGLGDSGVELAKGAGYRGDALRFPRKNTRAVYFKAAGNTGFRAGNWSGTIAFRLRLDPERDLEPGFCDPIQVTDKAYNDAAIWVDFTRDDKPRHFRLGVFGNRAAWNPQLIEEGKNPAFEKRLVVVRKTPFSREAWTHVAITFTGLGKAGGSARLYLNGEPVGDAPAIDEAFEWAVDQATIRLGVNYVGLFDDLAVYSRALSPQEIRTLNGR